MRKLYGSTKEKKKHKVLADQLKEMQEQYHITWEFCRTSMMPIGKKYGIHSVFALTKAEDVWRGVEKCLYENGKTLHFSKYGELPCVRGKQINRGIPMSVKDNQLRFKLGMTTFGIKIKDRCPSGFQTTIEKKFKVSGGMYIEVPNDYRASQYDHTADNYIKKKEHSLTRSKRIKSKY